MPIYVDTLGNGEINYIEFYGKKNRGKVDRGLYRSDDEQLNPEYSTINDTSAYFLAWTIGTWYTFTL